MTLPPYAELLGVEVQHMPDDEAVLVMPFAEGVIGRPGFVHGGALAGLLEMAAFLALQRALARDGGGHAKPITATVDFMRGGRDKPTHAAGSVIRLGSRIANVEAAAWQDDRTRPIAGGRFTFRIGRD